MLFIRDALENDLGGLWACAKRFETYAGYKEQGLPFDKKSFQDMARDYIRNPDGIVICMLDGTSVVGGIASMVHKWSFNRSIKVCIELYYWVDEGYRGFSAIRLLSEMEKQAKLLGASKVFMITVDTPLAEGVERLYLRRGYKKNEQQYVKTI